MKRTIGKSVLALAMAAGMSATAYAQQGVTDTEIRIGHNGDLSGVFAAFNVGAVKAAQKIFDEVNADGGIHGRQIRFITEDNGYQVPRAVQNFNKLVNSDQVFAMILNLGTPHNIAGFPIMEQAQVANVSPLTAARQMLEGDITYKYSGLGNYYDQMLVGLEYLANEYGATKLCSMYFPSDFGLEVFEATRDFAAETDGIEYVDETQHRADEQDFVGALQKLRESGCEIVSTAVGVRQTIVLLGTAKRLGWDDVAFIGSSAGFNTVVAKVPEGVTEGYYVAAGWSDFEHRMDNPAVRDFAEAYQASTGDPMGTAAQLGQGAARTLVMALEAAGPDLTPESFRLAMESVEFYDEINDVQVRVGEDHMSSNMAIISKIENGMWVEVERREVVASQ